PEFTRSIRAHALRPTPERAGREPDAARVPDPAADEVTASILVPKLSAWERTAGTLRVPSSCRQGAHSAGTLYSTRSVPDARSHAERGNEDYLFLKALWHCVHEFSSDCAAFHTPTGLVFRAPSAIAIDASRIWIDRSRHCPAFLSGANS